MNADYSDIIYFSEIRWLSQGKTLQRFYDLLHEIKSFLISKTKLVPELDDKNWITDLTFLVDLTAHLNKLNLCLQDENIFINTMHQTITAFSK